MNAYSVEGNIFTGVPGPPGPKGDPGDTPTLPDYSFEPHKTGRKWFDGKDIWEVTLQAKDSELIQENISATIPGSSVAKHLLYRFTNASSELITIKKIYLNCYTDCGSNEGFLELNVFDKITKLGYLKSNSNTEITYSKDILLKPYSYIEVWTNWDGTHSCQWKLNDTSYVEYSSKDYEKVDGNSIFEKITSDLLYKVVEYTESDPVVNDDDDEIEGDVDINK